LHYPKPISLRLSISVNFQLDIKTKQTRTPCLCSSLPDTLFMFERSREPCLCSSLFDTMFTFERSRELFVRQAESRTPFRIVTLRTISYLNNECHFYISKALLTYPSSDRLRLAFCFAPFLIFLSK